MSDFFFFFFFYVNKLVFKQGKRIGKLHTKQLPGQTWSWSCVGEISTEVSMLTDEPGPVTVQSFCARDVNACVFPPSSQYKLLVFHQFFSPPGINRQRG